MSADFRNSFTGKFPRKLYVYFYRNCCLHSSSCYTTLWKLRHAFWVHHFPSDTRSTWDSICWNKWCRFFPPTLWLPNSPDVNFIDYVDYVVWGILQDRVYKNQIRDYSGDYGYDGIYDQKVSMLDVWYHADCLCENDTFWPAFSFMNA